MNEVTKIPATGGGEDDNVGRSVAVDDDTMMAGTEDGVGNAVDS